MLKAILALSKGCLGVLLLGANIIVFTIILFIFAVLKFVLPIAKWRQFWHQAMHALPSSWINNNNRIFKLLLNVEWELVGLEQLSMQKKYLVIANHQSWIDILVLFSVFNRRIPFIKFFTKRQILWVPFLGWACALLDFPFVYRYSNSYLKKHPERKGIDVKVTQEFCEQHINEPITVLNFAEGTRFKDDKHAKQGAPYKHLLTPKAGGSAFTLAAMGDYLHAILDVTVVYVPKRASLLEFMCGEVNKIVVQVQEFPVTDELRGDYQQDRDFRRRFQAWINQLWNSKDVKISTILERELK